MPVYVAVGQGKRDCESSIQGLYSVQLGKRDEEIMDLNGRNHGVFKRGVRGTQGREEGALTSPQPEEEPEVNAPPEERTQAQDLQALPTCQEGRAGLQ